MKMPRPYVDSILTLATNQRRPIPRRMLHRTAAGWSVCDAMDLLEINPVTRGRYFLTMRALYRLRGRVIVRELHASALLQRGALVCLASLQSRHCINDPTGGIFATEYLIVLSAEGVRMECVILRRGRCG
jgi:hypothetical protein